MSKQDGLIIERVQLNQKGVVALLKSQEVMNELLRVAPSVGEVDTSFVGWDRCHVQFKRGKHKK